MSVIGEKQGEVNGKVTSVTMTAGGVVVNVDVEGGRLVRSCTRRRLAPRWMRRGRRARSRCEGKPFCRFGGL